MRRMPMLPTPYPDELWYSVVCRYHRRTGNIRFWTTFGELFGDLSKKTISIAGLDQTIESYAKTRGLPDSVRTKYVAENTLIPFLLRYYTPKSRREVIQTAWSGKTKLNISFIRPEKYRQGLVLRYCPECCKEDEENYGEMYWHRFHQIPMVTTCAKHRCLLCDTDILWRQASMKLFCADERVCPENTIQFPYKKSSEYKLDEYLLACLQAPYREDEITPTSQISDTLLMNGYAVWNQQGYRINTAAVYQVVSQHFDLRGEKNGYGKLLTHILDEERNSKAEFVAMLAAAIEVPASSFMAKKTNGKNKTVEARVLELSKKIGSRQASKIRIEQKLGISTEQLEAAVKRLGIPPFWKSNALDLEGEKRTHKVLIRVTQAERAEIEKRAEDLCMGTVAEYVRSCIMKDIQDSAGATEPMKGKCG